MFQVQPHAEVIPDTVLVMAREQRADLLALLRAHEGDCRCVWSVLHAHPDPYTYPDAYTYPCPPAMHPLCDWVDRPDRLHYLEGDDLFNACMAVAELVL